MFSDSILALFFSRIRGGLRALTQGELSPKPPELFPTKKSPKPKNQSEKLSKNRKFRHHRGLRPEPLQTLGFGHFSISFARNLSKSSIIFNATLELRKFV